MKCHGDDVALEVALEDAPAALVDRERGLARQARVRVRLGDDPRRRVRDALFTKSVPRQDSNDESRDTYQVQDLASEVESVKAVHDLLDARYVVVLQQSSATDGNQEKEERGRTQWT